MDYTPPSAINVYTIGGKNYPNISSYFEANGLPADSGIPSHIVTTITMPLHDPKYQYVTPVFDDIVGITGFEVQEHEYFAKLDENHLVEYITLNSNEADQKPILGDMRRWVRKGFQWEPVAGFNTPSNFALAKMNAVQRVDDMCDAFQRKFIGNVSNERGDRFAINAQAAANIVANRGSAAESAMLLEQYTAAVQRGDADVIAMGSLTNFIGWLANMNGKKLEMTGAIEAMRGTARADFAVATSFEDLTLKAKTLEYTAMARYKAITG